jgi:MinD-like ATPase involved in chromosome partitioning or flagellar assembly/WD40 repeat protein
MTSDLPRSGQVVTFYSYKGGVGRSMALANVAALLASKGKRVLVVDWDLEAPGIEQYFGRRFAEERQRTDGVVDMMEGLAKNEQISWRQCLIRVPIFGHEVHIISAGRKDQRYAARIAALSWKDLFEGHDLGRYLERLREDWTAADAYDFVLIDSRTGITDIGGICTIHLPDVVVGLFTANEQSLTGVAEALRSARAQHATLPVDRAQLLVVPVPARDESQSEHNKAKEWRARFARELEGFYADWLPEKVAPKDALEVLRIPYKAYWSFGEPMPVVEDGVSEPGSIGYAYALLASLVENGLDWNGMSAGRFSLPRAEKPPSPLRLALRYGAIGIALIGGLTLLLRHTSGPDSLPLSMTKDAGASLTIVNPRYEAIRAAAGKTKDPLYRTLLLREIPKEAFRPEDAQVLLKGARVPEAVFQSAGNAEFNSAGDRMVLTTPDGVTVVAANGRAAPLRLPIKPPPALAVFAAGDTKIVTAGAGGVSIWDAVTGKHTAEVDLFTKAKTPTRFIQGVASHDGKYVVLLSDANSPDGTLDIHSINVAAGTAFRWQVTKVKPLSIGVDGNRVLLTDLKGRTLALLDAPPYFKEVSVPISKRTFSREETRSVIAANGGWVVVAAMGTGDLFAWRGQAPGGAPIINEHRSLRTSLKDVAAGGQYYGAITDNGIVAFDGTSTQVGDVYKPSAGDATSIAFGGNVLVAGSSAGSVDMWTLDGVSIPQILWPSGERAIKRVALSRNGNVALALSGNGTVRVWRLDRGPLLERVDAPQVLQTLWNATSACLSAEDRVNLLGEDPRMAEVIASKCGNATLVAGAN